MNPAEYLNSDGALITAKQASEITNLGIVTVKRIASEAQADRKIGRSYRIDKQKLLSFIDREYRK